MFKTILIILAISILSACGQKSEIKPLFKPVKLSSSHGDGKHAIFSIKMPLSEKSIDPINSGIDPNANLLYRAPILGDFTNLFAQGLFNLGAALGLGKKIYVIPLPLPELDSPYLAGLSVKRIFFSIKDAENKFNVELPKKGWRKRIHQLQNFWNNLRAFIRAGESTANLGFLSELQMNLRSVMVENPSNDIVPFEKEVNPASLKEFNNPTDDKSIVLVRYNKKQSREQLHDNNPGEILLIEAEDPVKVKNHFNKDVKLNAMINEMSIINKTLMIQLKNDELALEDFITTMEESVVAFEKLTIKKLDLCTPSTCIDFVVNNQNLLSILKNGNQLNIETFMNAKKSPEKSFQLKGFVEFEVKLDLPL